MTVNLDRLKPAATVWLTPQTLTAPPVCWGEPRGEVVRRDHPYVVVQVAGAEHRVHVDNVRSTDPGVTRRADRPARPKPPLQGDGHEQPPLL